VPEYVTVPRTYRRGLTGFTLFAKCKTNICQRRVRRTGEGRARWVRFAKRPAIDFGDAGRTSRVLFQVDGVGTGGSSIERRDSFDADLEDGRLVNHLTQGRCRRDAARTTANDVVGDTIEHLAQDELAGLEQALHGDVRGPADIRTA